MYVSIYLYTHTHTHTHTHTQTHTERFTYIMIIRGHIPIHDRQNVKLMLLMGG